jgi:hypothetical protein
VCTVSRDAMEVIYKRDKSEKEVTILEKNVA